MGRYDPDGDAKPTYGPNANPAERSAIVALIRRYYTIAAAGDGSKACALLDPLVVERLMEEHARDKGASVRDASCPRLVSAVFDQHRRELSEDVARMQVIWIQLQAKQAVALVRFGPVRERVVRLRRRDGPWRMYALVDSGPL